MERVRKFVPVANIIAREALVTPLQQREIDSFLSDVRACKDRCSPERQERLLQQINRIEQHWQDNLGSPLQLARLIERMRDLIFSLVVLLLDDYCDASEKPDEWQESLELIPLRAYFMIFGTADQRQKAAVALTNGDESRLDEAFEKFVGPLLKELLLDRTHIKRRFRAAAIGASLVRSHQDTISRDLLRETVNKDRAMLCKVVEFGERLGTFKLDLRESNDFLKDKMDQFDRQSQPPVRNRSQSGIAGKLLRAIGMETRPSLPPVRDGYQRLQQSSLMLKKQL